MKADTPSSTACLVALGCLAVLRRSSRSRDARVGPLLESFLQHAPAPYPQVSRAIRFPPARVALQAAADAIVPGMFSHYVARKLAIESAVRGTLERWESAACESGSGVRGTLVVVGGGLDTLAIRVALDVPGARVVEIDHPATQVLKVRGLRSAGVAPANLEFLAVDLGVEAVADVLARAGIGAGGRTVFVFEGVSMYLSEVNNRLAFEAFLRCGDAGRGAEGNTCVFTFFEPLTGGRLGFAGSRLAAVDAWLGRNAEPFVWGASEGRLRHLLTSIGWREVRVLESRDLWDAFREATGLDDRPAQGERVALALDVSPVAALGDHRASPQVRPWESDPSDGTGNGVQTWQRNKAGTTGERAGRVGGESGPRSGS